MFLLFVDLRNNVFYNYVGPVTKQSLSWENAFIFLIDKLTATNKITQWNKDYHTTINNVIMLIEIGYESDELLIALIYYIYKLTISSNSKPTQKTSNSIGWE